MTVPNGGGPNGAALDERQIRDGLDALQSFDAHRQEVIRSRTAEVESALKAEDLPAAHRSLLAGMEAAGWASRPPSRAAYNTPPSAVEQPAEPDSPEVEASKNPVSLKRLLEMVIAEPTWLVRPWIQSLSVAVIYGDSQAGKTWLAFLWLLQLASEGLRVLVVEGEGSLGDTLERLRLVAKGLGLDLAKLADADRLYLWQDSGIDLRESDDVERLTAKAKGYDIVFVDTVSAHAPGSDEGAAEMSLIMHGLRHVRTHARTTVLACHHVTKAAAEKGKANMSNASGHSNMKRLADAMVEVASGEPKDGRITFTITTTKQRAAGRADPVRGELRIDSEGAVFTWEKAPEHQAPQFDDAEVVAFLDSLPADGRSVGVEALAKATHRRPDTLRRLANHCVDQGWVTRTRAGVSRGPVRHLSQTHPGRVPEVEEPTHPAIPVPVPLYRDGSDGWDSPRVADRTGNGTPIPSGPDGSQSEPSEGWDSGAPADGGRP